MRHFLRRIILFPFSIVMAPSIYLIGWLLYGHDYALEGTVGFVKEMWGMGND